MIFWIFYAISPVFSQISTIEKEWSKSVIPRIQLTIRLSRYFSAINIHQGAIVLQLICSPSGGYQWI